MTGLAEKVSKSPALREKFRQAIRRSREAGVEMGFPLCSNGNLEAGGDIAAGEREMTKGTETKMRIVQGCPLTGGKFLGSFHAHVAGPIQPSRLDLLSMMGSEEQVLCTGKDDRAYCVERKPGTGPTEIRRTVRRLTEAGGGTGLPDADTYRKIVGRTFHIRDFQLNEIDRK